MSTAPAATTAPHCPEGRPCLACEMSPQAIARALPAGAELAPAASWLEEVRSTAYGEHVRADFRARILAVADLIHGARTPSKGVSMPGVGRLAELLGLKDARPVRRVLAWLRERLLLVTVAEGRSADWSRTGSALRAVFALARPVDVDTTVRPSVEPKSPGRNPLARALDFARKAAGGATYRRMTREEIDAPLWHGHKAVSEEDELLATHEFMRRLRPYAFKETSAQALRPVLAPFFQAGATVRRLLDMLDNRPDGSAFPHDGANGVKNYVAWAAKRLAAWS